MLRRAYAVAALGIALCARAADGREGRPNVLLISVDDLNDWVRALDRRSQARTPHIDRLARRGVLFANAHAQAPICTPSRASMMSGLRPSTTGLYFLEPGLRASPVTRDRPTLIQRFAAAGYLTMGAGKVVKGQGEDEARYFQDHGGPMGGFGPFPARKLTTLGGLREWDFGPFPEDEHAMPDTQVADWVIERLRRRHDRPFLLAAGFWRPHVPLYAPPRWFRPFPLGTVRLPPVLAGDRDDLPPYARDLTDGVPEAPHAWFVDNGTWRDGVRAYLASMAYVDHQIGRVLAALDASPYRQDTVVVLFSDNGWHLGEKGLWGKRTLWERATRVPLVIAAPDLPRGRVSRRPVGLIDVYPTLLELARLPPNPDLEGRSLVEAMKRPDAVEGPPVISTFGPGNHAVRSARWRYIRYADGGEELYDHAVDPHEWHNVAAVAANAAVVAELRRHLPARNAPPVLTASFDRWEVAAWKRAEQNAAARR